VKGLLERTQDEVSRLASNWRMFYEHMPDMLFIIKDNFVIESMNRKAINVFGDLNGKKCHVGIFGCQSPCEKSLCPILCAWSRDTFCDLVERKINNELYVECSYVPLEGYRNDKLVLVSMRDVTLRKLHEAKLEKYQNNLVKVLQEKISDLNESEKMRQQLAHEVDDLKESINRMIGPDEMIGESRPLRELREMIYKVAATEATVLITGESGTGKDLVADLIYSHSNRVGKPYLKFNCAAVSESLLESDLFGYEKGAFTGANACRKGKFEIANGGTIFLDEIGDISARMQSSLLRVLQNGEIVRVGGTAALKVDVRVIAATNVDLVKAVEQGRFRQDLYYRLNVINLHQRPLRERKEDIVMLASHFLKKYREAFSKEISFLLPDDVIAALLRYDWPGNIRELDNTIQRAVLLCTDYTITLADLNLGAVPTSTAEPGGMTESVDCEALACQPLRDSVADFEAKILAAALRKWQGSTQDIATNLVIGKTALYEKMKRYGLNPKEFKN